MAAAGVGFVVALEISTTLPDLPTCFFMMAGHDVGLGVIIGRLLLFHRHQPFVDLLIGSRGNSLCGVKLAVTALLLPSFGRLVTSPFTKLRLLCLVEKIIFFFLAVSKGNSTGSFTFLGSKG